MSAEIIFILIAAAVAFYVYNRMTKFSAVSSLGAKKTDDVVSAPIATASRVLICFASQTGTAEGFAKTLAREGKRMGLVCSIQDIDDLQTNTILDEKMIVFIVATYGEGEPTDSAKRVYQWLFDAERGEQELRGLKYTVFGLGDRQYQHYCRAGVDLDERLAKLGGERVYGLGTGDAGRTLEEDFDGWRQTLWTRLGHELGVKIIPLDERMTPENKLKYVEGKSARPFPQALTTIQPTQKQPVFGKVLAKPILVQDTDRLVIKVDIDIEGSSLSYQAGDHLGVMPHNPDFIVDDYLAALGLTSDDGKKIVTLNNMQNRNVFPCRVSVRDVLSWYVDLCGHPKKATLRVFAQYCEDGAQRDAMVDLLKVENSAAFHELEKRCHTVLDFLRHFSSCRVPLEHFLDAMPRLQPRYFSIASDQLVMLKSVSIIVAVVPNGVCTGMLQAIPVGAELPVFVRPSKFHLPLKDKKKPLILIGPGTGVAPLVGFCQRRVAWQSRGAELGRCLLYYGCRRDSDFIEKAFLNDCAAKGIVELDVAISRPPPPQPKVYVQHRIAQREMEVWSLLHEGNANIYVCGDAKNMARDVDDTLAAMCMKYGQMTREAASAFLQKLQQQDRYLRDVWTA